MNSEKKAYYGDSWGALTWLRFADAMLTIGVDAEPSCPRSDGEKFCWITVDVANLQRPEMWRESGDE
ncbi:hypothetical protein PQR66_27105 [Paraburkholderia agricolaris]|uniref:Uncharacterized protein n=1 Tax=Paraburkholderia agricolaris TaxID=2152888 RepID=A0ABW8ZWL3_9BURK